MDKLALPERGITVAVTYVYPHFNQRTFMLKSKLLTALSICLIWSSTAQSQEASEAINKLTDIMSCVESNGDLAHKISKTNTGHYSAYISFRKYDKIPGEAELEESKKQWKKWDGTLENRPADPRKIGVALPIDSGNIFNYDIKRLTEKAEYFDSLFPPISKTSTNPESSKIPPGYGSFSILFAENECTIIEAEGLMKVYCENFDSVSINNIEVTQRVLELSSEVTSEVILDQETQKNIILKTPRVKASLILKTKQGQRIRNFRSSYTYLPNGNDKQCLVNGKKITEQ